MLAFPKILLVCIAILLLSPSSAYAQGDNFDVLISKAKYHTTEEIDYSQAENYAKSALKLKPQHQDLKILLARIYWLSNQFDLSENTFKEALQNDTESIELHIQILNLYESQSKFTKAYNWIEHSLSKFPKDENLLFRKAYNLDQQGYEQLAFKVSKELLSINPDHEKAKYIHDKLYPKNVDNFILASYSNYYSTNSEANNLTFYNLQYGRRIKSSTLVGMMTMLQNGNEKAMLYSAELYSKINKHTSSYLRMSASSSDLLPYLRLNGEITRGFKKGYEAYFRLSVLLLENETVEIWSPGIGKYYKNLYLTFNTNLIRKSSGLEWTYNLKFRRYFSNPQNYLGASIGSVPSDDIIGFRPDRNMSAIFFALEGKMKVSLRSSIGLSYLKNIQKSVQSRDLISVFVRQDF